MEKGADRQNPKRIAQIRSAELERQRLRTEMIYQGIDNLLLLQRRH
jgi:hypothetical protein